MQNLLTQIINFVRLHLTTSIKRVCYVMLCYVMGMTVLLHADTCIQGERAWNQVDALPSTSVCMHRAMATAGV